MPNTEQVGEGLLAQFKVEKYKGTESLLKAAHQIYLQNEWYRAYDNLDVADLTQSQREVLSRFGKLYGLNQIEIDILLTITTKSHIIDITGLDSTTVGLTAHCPKDFLFTDQKLTPNGYALVNILVESVSGDISQYGANAIMACIGFYPTPTQEERTNSVRDDFERYLTGKKGYMPGLDQIIIKKNKKKRG